MINRNKLEESLERNDYENLFLYIQESSNYLKSLLENSNFAELEKVLEHEKNHTAYYIKKEYAEQNIHFIFGRYVGLMDVIYDQLSNESQMLQFKNKIEEYDISEIPHVNEIILSIHRDEGIRHGKLADNIGIDKSTLTGIMDKLVDKGAVTFTRPGKYKYYYLSKFGKAYYENNKKFLEVGSNIETLIEQILLCLSKEENATDRALEIITALCRGKSKSNGYNYKIKGNVDTSRVFAAIPSIKAVNVMFPESKKIHTINQAMTFYFNQDSPFVRLIDNNNENFTERSTIPELDLISI